MKAVIFIVYQIKTSQIYVVLRMAKLTKALYFCITNYNQFNMFKRSQSASQFSEAEIEIIQWVRKGKTSVEIAELRNCSPRTIEKHRSNIIKKLAIKPSPNAILIWAMNNPKFD